MFLTSCIVRNGAKIIHYSPFLYNSWFYEFYCVLSQIFLLPGWRELLYLNFFIWSSFHTCDISCWFSLFSNSAKCYKWSFILLVSISFQKYPESPVWKLGLIVLKWKPIYLRSPLFFIYFISLDSCRWRFRFQMFFIQRKGIHRHQILQSVPLPLLSLLCILVAKSNGLLSFKIFFFLMHAVYWQTIVWVTGTNIHPVNTLPHPCPPMY